MKQLFNNILGYARRYPFTFLAILLSTLISILMFIITFDVWRPTIFSLLGLLPTFIFILGAYIWQKISKDKHKIVQGIFLFIINCTFLVCQLVYSLIIADAGATYASSRPLNNYKRYAEVIKSNDEYLKEVFPLEISKDAKNIKMSGSVSSPMAVFYRKDIALSFDTTSEYIDSELKKFDTIKPFSINKSDVHKKILTRYGSTLPIKHMDDGIYNVYPVLYKLEHPDENHENSFIGYCAVNKGSKRIIYYYEKLYGDYCDSCYKRDSKKVY